MILRKILFPAVFFFSTISLSANYGAFNTILPKYVKIFYSGGNQVAVSLEIFNSIPDNLENITAIDFSNVELTHIPSKVLELPNLKILDLSNTGILDINLKKSKITGSPEEPFILRIGTLKPQKIRVNPLVFCRILDEKSDLSDYSNFLNTPPIIPKIKICYSDIDGDKVLDECTLQEFETRLDDLIEEKATIISIDFSGVRLNEVPQKVLSLTELEELNFCRTGMVDLDFRNSNFKGSDEKRFNFKVGYDIKNLQPPNITYNVLLENVVPDIFTSKGNYSSIGLRVSLYIKITYGNNQLFNILPIHFNLALPQLRNITEIDFSGIKLDEIPKDVLCLENLKYLNLTRTGVTKIDLRGSNFTGTPENPFVLMLGGEEPIKEIYLNPNTYYRLLDGTLDREGVYNFISKEHNELNSIYLNASDIQSEEDLLRFASVFGPNVYGDCQLKKKLHFKGAPSNFLYDALNIKKLNTELKLSFDDFLIIVKCAPAEHSIRIYCKGLTCEEAKDSSFVNSPFVELVQNFLSMLIKAREKYQSNELLSNEL